MDYRRSSLVVNQQQLENAHANSHIYASFAGTIHNRNSNRLTDALTLWWDEERIEATVTHQFVASKLKPDEQERLEEPLRFGDGLTDNTYMEWIEEKAQRIFLILVDLGVPDQIFGVIDDSWDDEDLPIPLNQVERLQLTYDKDEKLERKFFQRQFNYLLKYIQKGEHICYDDLEIIPLELAETRSTVAMNSLAQNYTDKVHLPGRPDDVFIRRRVPLGTESGQFPREEFFSCIEALKAVQHNHRISLWASYIHKGNGYLLLTPVDEISLKTALTTTPQCLKILSKQDRRILLLNWLHCLADALSHLHSKGLSQGFIIPSNIMLDIDNKIFLGAQRICPLLNFNIDKRNLTNEIYEYSAPEEALQPIQPSSSISKPPLSRRPSTTPSSTKSRKSVTLFTTPSSSSTSSHSASLKDDSSIYITSSNSFPSRKNSLFTPNSFPNNLTYDPQKADIFSLGTIYLEILALFLKRTTRSFTSHRSSKTNPSLSRGSKGGSEIPDSSFHKALPNVETWISLLSKDASKKEDKLFRSISPILSLIRKMLSLDPLLRPTASEIQERIYDILNTQASLPTSKIHCSPPHTSAQTSHFGFDQLRLASQRAAAEACASVAAPLGSNVETSQLALGNGGVIYGVEKMVSVGGRERETDGGSVGGKSSSRDSGGGRKGGNSGNGEGKEKGKKPKAKAKAWRAPVYAELSFG